VETTRRNLLHRTHCLGLLALLAVWITGSRAIGQQPAVAAGDFNNVGGISINADGLLDNASLDAQGRLSQLRAAALEKIPADLRGTVALRKLSLRGLEAAISQCAKNGKPLPEQIRFLGGLQGIRYVLVYPERHDIVLVGPGEGWKVDARGNMVGTTTGRPVLLLDDLLVALRTAEQAARGGITCSIDPTAEGLRQLRGYVATLHTIGDPDTTAANIAKTLGPQNITFSGVPVTSHFARVLVAADYRMKRLAMGFEPAPVRGLPSFLAMMKAGGKGMSSMLPRWWLEPKYDALLRDADGLAWELRGSSVKAMTEEDFLKTTGSREHTGKANPVAQRWADNMTAKYDELAVAEPIFGDLRNCMELAIVGAMVVKENLATKAGFSMPVLMDSNLLKPDAYAAPKQVDSKASLLKKGHNWLISASGGVTIQSWMVVDRAEKSDAPAAMRAKLSSGATTAWCWN